VRVAVRSIVPCDGTHGCCQQQYDNFILFANCVEYGNYSIYSLFTGQASGCCLYS